MISAFRVWRYELPLDAPVSLKKGVAMSVREGLLLEVVSDTGGSFWGEAAPLPGFSRESLEEAARELEAAARTRIEAFSTPARTSGESLEKIRRAKDAPPSVRFALDAAFSNEAAGEGLLPSEAPGVRDSLALCGLLSGERDEVLSEAGRMRAAGYEAVKLKVGRGAIEEDVALVGEVRETLGDGVELRLDANRAWSFEEAMEFARRIPDIEFIEEPLADAGRLPELAARSGLPVALDESLVEASAGAFAPADHAYARAFVLKPTLLGYFETLRLARDAPEGRKPAVETVISAAYESGVGMLALISLAASTHGGTAPGLDTYRRLAEDVIQPPLDLSGPRLNVRETLAVRREVDYERLERLA